MKKSYVIWDKFDQVIHRSHLTKKEARAWMATARSVFGLRPEGVDEVWEILPVSTPKVFRTIVAEVAAKLPQ